jgi:ubiquinone/menaquinone biosynthesis C-methylase UbiE
MATVFMKWLETNPADYDRGIRLLTLGRIRRIHEWIAERAVQPGTRALEIGCGTGTLAAMMAKRGAVVTAIDASASMLAVAQRRIAALDLQESVSFKRMDATQIGDHFEQGAFDLIVSTLVFSELPADERQYVLSQCARVLAPGGQLIIADEVLPESALKRFLFRLIRLPLVVLTWLLTRTTTTPLRDFESTLAQTGFVENKGASFLGGSLLIHTASLPGMRPSGQTYPKAEADIYPRSVPRLRHRVTLRTLLMDLWLLFFRIIPPYPKIMPGLYAVGTPDRRSPVLVTGNFDLTVRRLVRAIDGVVDAWILVADSAGINVWCAAGGGYFTAEKVIAALKTAQLKERVDHHALILPQLCANGVDGWLIRRETGWGVFWGPARARDIPDYLQRKRRKTDTMRWVRFPLKDRLEMVTVTLGFYGLLILLPVLIFWREHFWPITLSLLGLSYFYAIVHPWLPGRDGLQKAVPLTLISMAGLVLYALLVAPLPRLSFFHWIVGLTGLSVFTAAELQGMSPLMRGEQANWSREAVIGAVLLALNWLIPRAAGWMA